MNTHLGFVIIAYGVTAVALVIAICWIMIDQRVLKRELQQLEAQGLRRRSAKPASGPAK